MRKTRRAHFHLTSLVASVCLVLASCGEDKRSQSDAKRPARNAERFSTDLHVAIAEHPLVLPFAALDDYAYRKQSFSLDPKRDRDRAIDAVNTLLRDSADPTHPLAFDQLSVRVETYGWNDFDVQQRHFCSLMRREWARSVCDNPWAAIQQALPRDRFKLVDLGRLDITDRRGPANCVNPAEQRQHLPQAAGEAAILCEAQVLGGSDHYRAVIRIDGDLGALWYMSGKVLDGETAEARIEREGQAISAFVRYALGPTENFPKLHAVMCQLRRPLWSDHPNRPPDCAK
jgi:hypothetical protein